MSTTAIIPLKAPNRAKSRLLLDANTRLALADSFARDLIAACMSCPDIDQCLVVGTAPRDIAVPQIPDPGNGLNQALLTAASSLSPEAAIVILMGDLPCVGSDDLTRVLKYWRETPQAIERGAYVSDLAGVGTTAILGRGRSLQPQFGARSRAKHRESGLVELTQPDLLPLRRDVDSLIDLADASRIGVGIHTLDCVNDLGLTMNTS